MLKTDRWLMRMGERDMISPYEENLIRNVNGKKVISYGQSSFGYDIRLGKKFKFVPDKKDETIIVDVKKENFEQIYIDIEVHKRFVLAPGAMILGVSEEYITMPRNTMAICVGKSTYARCGLIVNVTPLEPGWAGEITLEIHNATKTPIAVYPGEGIAQLLFFKSEEEPIFSYSDRKGKYQNQRGVTLAKV